MDRFIFFLVIVISVVFLDLTTKNIAVKLLSNKDITIIPDILDLTLVWNKGAAFGIFANSPEWIRKLALLGASSIAVLATAVYAFSKRKELSNLETIFLGLIAGGAVGNLYDRFILGKVRDFIDFHILNYHWPAFNIADASITIGIAGFIFNELYLKKRLKNKQDDKI
ncbi:signal peptidase II [Hydrogenivirga sp. 128-5-R1-1]|uniref:signal peptidase II n=1 Tax=Hydrogenivirga sp. 128-5-R1-1 TaxID=392423 RepID=UPI00015F0264|nr:signal peptidase II [Hydrogenivirga sp. 128-5-R1-1]EDP73972.1 lipoprotein signal peptidase [Hydrogenivirga sp. 128-5-R1-1]